MRKLIIVAMMAAIAVPATVSAQSRGEIRHDRREVREERQDLRHARQYGDRQDVRRERRDVRGARQELREDRRDRRAYVAPYRGWSYRAVSPGYRLRSAFYGPRYTISNPGYYRLAPASGTRRWIRYGDDLLLVNVRTGRIIQVVRNRYW